MRHALFSFHSLFGEKKKVHVAGDLNWCGVCINPTREKDFILEENAQMCLCTSSGLFFGNNLTIEAQYIPTGSITARYLGKFSGTNLVIFPSGRGTVALTTSFRQVVHFYPIDAIPKRTDLETHQIYLTTQGQGSFEISNRVDQYSDIFYQTRYSFMSISMSSIDLDFSNPSKTQFSCSNFEQASYRTSLEQSSYQAHYSALCSFADSSLIPEENRKTIPEEKVTIHYNIRTNPDIPLLFGLLPTEAGIYSWGKPPSPTPYIDEDANGLSTIEITGIVIGCVIGVTFILIFIMYCYYAFKLRKIEGKI